MKGLKLVGLNALVFVVLLFVLEGIIRLNPPSWLVYRMEILNSGEANYANDQGMWKHVQYNSKGTIVSFIPGTQGGITHPEYSNNYSIASSGGRYSGVSKQADTILFFGDSFTFGVGVEDLETFSSIYQGKHQINVFNMGIPGSSLPHDIKRFEHFLEKFKPERVFFFWFMGNDFLDILRAEGKTIENRTSKLSIGEVQEPKKERLNRGLVWSLNKWVNNNTFLRNIYLIQFIKKSLLGLMNNKKSSVQMAGIFKLMEPNSHWLEMGRKKCEKSLQDLKTLLDSSNVEGSIIIIPDVYQIDANKRMEMMGYYGMDSVDVYAPNRALKTLGERYQIPIYDPTECLLKKDGIRDWYYPMDQHFTAEGHRTYWDCIETFITKN